MFYKDILRHFVLRNNIQLWCPYIYQRSNTHQYFKNYIKKNKHLFYSLFSELCERNQWWRRSEHLQIPGVALSFLNPCQRKLSRSWEGLIMCPIRPQWWSLLRLQSHPYPCFLSVLLATENNHLSPPTLNLHRKVTNGDLF